MNHNPASVFLNITNRYTKTGHQISSIHWLALSFSFLRWEIMVVLYSPDPFYPLSLKIISFRTWQVLGGTTCHWPSCPDGQTLEEHASQGIICLWTRWRTSERLWITLPVHIPCRHMPELFRCVIYGYRSDLWLIYSLWVKPRWQGGHRSHANTLEVQSTLMTLCRWSWKAWR